MKFEMADAVRAWAVIVRGDRLTAALAALSSREIERIGKGIGMGLYQERWRLRDD